MRQTACGILEVSENELDIMAGKWFEAECHTLKETVKGLCNLWLMNIMSFSKGTKSPATAFTALSKTSVAKCSHV